MHIPIGHTTKRFSKWLFIIALLLNTISFAGYSANSQAEQQIVPIELVHSEFVTTNKKTALFYTQVSDLFLELQKLHTYYTSVFLHYYSQLIQVKWQDLNRHFIVIKEEIQHSLLQVMAIVYPTVHTSRFRL
ncbi:hypothetical protein [Flavobacterium sp. '19STA2R22 D10 B1']|uniref:hypothetical protein n=1 Tax=Flavobacterium aerium TaxID=3037261 RepID=UPI00278C43FC|nr:hypothetical protein [Flavobacterium sp. '19STA2R22 D10 B1']